MCRIKDPLFLSVLVLPALVDNQRAPHSGEQLEKTLQEEADKKKMENMENICREWWKKTTTCDTFGGINTESKAECLIPEWLKGHRDPTRDSVCSEARVWGNTSQEGERQNDVSVLQCRHILTVWMFQLLFVWFFIFTNMQNGFC